MFCLVGTWFSNKVMEGGDIFKQVLPIFCAVGIAKSIRHPDVTSGMKPMMRPKNSAPDRPRIGSHARKWTVRKSQISLKTSRLFNFFHSPGIPRPWGTQTSRADDIRGFEWTWMDSHPPKNPYGTVAESEFHSHSSLASQEEPEDKNLRLLAQIGEFEIYIYIHSIHPGTCF